MSPSTPSTRRAHAITAPHTGRPGGHDRLAAPLRDQARPHRHGRLPRLHRPVHAPRVRRAQVPALPRLRRGQCINQRSWRLRATFYFDWSSCVSGHSGVTTRKRAPDVVDWSPQYSRNWRNWAFHIIHLLASPSTSHRTPDSLVDLRTGRGLHAPGAVGQHPPLRQAPNLCPGRHARIVRRGRVAAGRICALHVSAVWKSSSDFREPPRHRADAAAGTTSRRWRGIAAPSRRRSYGSTSRRWRGAPEI